MLGSTVLEVAIGLSLVFWFLSVVCSALNEALAGLFSARSFTLKQGVERLLGDPALSAQLRDHPMIKGLSKKDGRFPSYIPSQTFALALIDQIMRGHGGATGSPLPSQGLGSDASGFVAPTQNEAALSALRAALPQWGPLPALLADHAVDDITKAQEAIARWFDDGMDRASGWYKRRARVIMAFLAIAVSVGLNIDAIRVAEALARDTTLRASIVASSEAAAKVPATPTTKGEAATPLTRAVAIERELEHLHMPIGWSEWPPQHDLWYSSIPGWLITALAASLGAPFWFDLLNKMVNLRSAGKPPEKSEKKELKAALIKAASTGSG